jgi:Na+-driven multidrug efflux pump
MLGMILNVPLNYTLIFGLFSFQGFGIKGAAWATVISKFFALLPLCIAYFSPKNKTLYNTVNFIINISIIKKITIIPSSIQE